MFRTAFAGIIGAFVAVGFLIAADAAQENATKKEMEKLQGTWQLVAAEIFRAGSAFKGPKEEVELEKVIIKGDNWTLRREAVGDKKSGLEIKEGSEERARYHLGATKEPKTIDLVWTDGDRKGQTFPGVYSLEGDTLKICYAREGSVRPTGFTAEATKQIKDHCVLMVLKRKMPPNSKKAAAKEDIERLQGVWTGVAMEELGKKLPEEDVREVVLSLTITGAKALMKMRKEDPGSAWTFDLDPTKTPKAIDIKLADDGDEKDRIALGIYELHGKALRLCYNQPSTKKRPTEFVTKAEEFSTTIVFKRMSPKEASAFAAGGPPKRGKKLEGLRSAVFSPDGLRIAALSDSSPGYPDTLKVWDVATGKLELAIPSPKASMTCVLFTPDGKQLISSHRQLASKDGKVFEFQNTVKVWDASSGKGVRTLETSGEVRRLLLSGNGERLFAVSYNPSEPIGASEIKCWRLPTGRELFTIRQSDRGRDPEKDVGYSIQLHNLELSPDGRHLAAPCDSSVIKVWDAGTGKEVLSVAHPFRPTQPIAFSPDSKRFAAVDHKAAEPAVIVWDVATGKPRKLASLDRETDFRFLTFSPDGKRLALGGNQQVRVFDAGAGKRLHLFKTATVVHHTTFSPDSKSLAAACGDFNEIFGSEGDVKMWDLASGNLLHDFRRQRGSVQQVAFNRDGSRLISFNQVSLMLWSLDAK